MTPMHYPFGSCIHLSAWTSKIYCFSLIYLIIIVTLIILCKASAKADPHSYILTYSQPLLKATSCHIHHSLSTCTVCCC